MEEKDLNRQIMREVFEIFNIVIDYEGDKESENETAILVTGVDMDQYELNIHFNDKITKEMIIDALKTFSVSLSHKKPGSTFKMKVPKKIFPYRDGPFRFREKRPRTLEI